MGNQNKKQLEKKQEEKNEKNNINSELETSSRKIINESYLPYCYIFKELKFDDIIRKTSISKDGRYIACYSKDIIILDGFNFNFLFEISLNEVLKFSFHFQNLLFKGNKLITSSNIRESYFRVYDVSKKILQYSEELRESITCMILTPNEDFIICALLSDYQYGFGKSCIQIRDSNDYREIHLFNAHYSGIVAIECTKDSKKILSSSQDKDLKIWDISTFECLNTYTFQDSIINCILNFKDVIVLGLQKSRILFCDFDGNILDELNQHKRSIVSLFREGNVLISGSDDGTIKLWNIESKLLLQSFGKQGIDHEIFSMTTNVNNYFISTSGGKDLKIFKYYDFTREYQILNRETFCDIKFKFN